MDAPKSPSDATHEIDVSVIVAAWSAADFIEPAIVSALSQDGVSLEVIVVDDASPDETLAAARRAGRGDERLVLHRLSQNGGPSRARNAAIDMARGRYVAVLDADDSFVPGRLAHMVALADETVSDICVDNMNRVSLIGADGAGAPAFLDTQALFAPVEISLADYLSPFTEERFGENLGYLKPLFRRQTLLDTGERYDLTLRNSEDYYLVASLLARGARMTLAPERGYNYLIRPGSISHRLTPQMTAAILAADDAFATRFSSVLSDEARIAHGERRAALVRSHAFELVVAGLKARNVGAVVSALSGHPGAVGHTARRLADIALAKLPGRARQNRMDMSQNPPDQTPAQ